MFLHRTPEVQASRAAPTELQNYNYSVFFLSVVKFQICCKAQRKSLLEAMSPPALITIARLSFILLLNFGLYSAQFWELVDGEEGKSVSEPLPPLQRLSWNIANSFSPLSTNQNIVIITMMTWGLDVILLQRRQ